MAPIIQAVQILSISTSLIASGGIAGLSLFDAQLLQSQPASRSLPQIRWLFSRGSHIFPQAAFSSAAGFVYLAYNALPTGRQNLLQLAKLGSNNRAVNGLLVAAALSMSIAPVTSLMLPTNFAMIRLNEDKGGARSKADASERDGASEINDLSVPMEKTRKETTKAEDEDTKKLLKDFAKLNFVRAVLLASGGIVGLTSILA